MVTIWEVTLLFTSKLNDSPELVNEDPHGRGWILRLKVSDTSELEKLMSVDEYEKFLEGLEG